MMKRGLGKRRSFSRQQPSSRNLEMMVVEIGLVALEPRQVPTSDVEK